MIPGTSKTSLSLGPIIGHFWALGPRISGFSYTKLLQNILESIWEHLGKYYFSMSVNQNFRKFRKVNPHVFFEFIFWILFLYIF